jgi:hypothetical protein
MSPLQVFKYYSKVNFVLPLFLVQFFNFVKTRADQIKGRLLVGSAFGKVWVRVFPEMEPAIPHLARAVCTTVFIHVDTTRGCRSVSLYFNNSTHA